MVCQCSIKGVRQCVQVDIEMCQGMPCGHVGLVMYHNLLFSQPCAVLWCAVVLALQTMLLC